MKDPSPRSPVSEQSFEAAPQTAEYLSGWRLFMGLSGFAYVAQLEAIYLRLTFSRISISFFLSMLDATIIATALVTISNELNDAGRSSWIILSYLSTYTGKKPMVFHKLR
jgi:hypothetical protein